MRIFVLVFACAWLTLAIEIIRFGRQDQAQPADAAIVLGAGVWRDRPSAVFRARINHALNLYDDGLVDTLIFTGGVGQFSEYSEAEIARRYAIDRGIPSEDILN